MEPPSYPSHRSKHRPFARRRKSSGPSLAAAARDTPRRRVSLRGVVFAVFCALAVAIFPARFPLPALAQDAPTGENGASAAEAAAGGDMSFLAWSIGLVLLLTLFNALFVMAETALVSVRRSRVEQLVEEGSRAAVAVKRLVDNPPRFIATVQVGITLLGFASAVAAATTLSRPLARPLTALLGDAARADTVAVICVTILIAFVSMVLGEIAPKSIALKSPDVWALRLSPLVNFFATLFAPLTWLALRASNLLVRPFGIKAEFSAPVITEEELRQIIEAGEEHGELEEDEREMLHNVFDLGETLVRSVMTPRTSMSAVPVEADMQAVLDEILTSGHSRLPVYEETTDKIVGIIHAKDLLPIFQTDERHLDLRRVMRAAYFVPETRRVSDLLKEFRRSNQQIAIVQDEYAGTEGIVTIEDLLEEIVGDIRDEYDVDEPEVQVVSATESLIDGLMSIDDVNDRLGTDLPHEDYETIGGLIFGMLGHEPMPGDRVRHDGLEFLVERIEGTRIHTLRATKVGAAGAEES